MEMKKIFLVIIGILLIFGCDKDSLYWDLPSQNIHHVQITKNATLAKYFNCEKLEDFNLLVDKLSSSRNEEWEVGNGFIGKGLVLSSPNYGGSIEFYINFSKNSYMIFWTKSVNPGYPNRNPEVYIDGINSNYKVIENNSGWMKIATEKIYSGNHLMKINYPHISTYYDYFIDEIEFFYP